MLLIERDINLIIAHAVVIYDLRLFNILNHLGKNDTKFEKWIMREHIRKIKKNPNTYIGIMPESYTMFAGLYERLKQNYMAWLLFNKYNCDYAQLKLMLGADYKSHMRNYQNYRSSRRRKKKNAGNVDFFRRLALVANTHKKLTLESTIHLYRIYSPTQVINRMRSAIEGIKEGCVIPRLLVNNHKRTLKRWTGLDFRQIQKLPFKDIKSRAIERFFRTRFNREDMEVFLIKEYRKKTSKDYIKNNGFNNLILRSEKKKCTTYEEFMKLTITRIWTNINYSNIPMDTLGVMDINMPPRFKYKRRHLSNGKRFASYERLFTY